MASPFIFKKGVCFRRGKGCGLVLLMARSDINEENPPLLQVKKGVVV